MVRYTFEFFYFEIPQKFLKTSLKPLMLDDDVDET